MRLRRRRSGEEPPAADDAPADAPAAGGVRDWQPRLYLRLVILLLVLAYVVGFVLENRKRVHVHFVLGTANVSLIWLILLSIALGLLGGVLVSQLHRRRRRRD